ncbi:MAG: hypothetical protein AVDCRST_MAG73-1578, partial [uncultured Thermomicrobiales bacterium]
VAVPAEAQDRCMPGERIAGPGREQGDDDDDHDHDHRHGHDLRQADRLPLPRAGPSGRRRRLRDRGLDQPRPPDRVRRRQRPGQRPDRRGAGRGRAAGAGRDLARRLLRRLLAGV